MLRDKIHDTAFQLLGPTTRNNQDWFDENDEEIKEMLAEKNRLHRIYQLDQSSAAKNTAFTNIRRTVQTRLLVHMSNREPRNVLSYELFLLICTHMGS